MTKHTVTFPRSPYTLRSRLLFSTFRIESETEGGYKTGTGFIFDYVEGPYSAKFLVSNKHVVNEATAWNLYFIENDGEANLTRSPFFVKVLKKDKGWYGHPDENIDIAVLPLQHILDETSNKGRSFSFSAVLKEMVPTKENENIIDAIEEVIFIGYPKNLYDSINLTPIVRRGITATPINLDFRGEPIFLIDATVLPGSSGSPVYLCNSGSGITEKNELVIMNRLFLVGIISETLQYDERGIAIIPTQPQPTAIDIFTKANMALGVVIKSSKVLETIELCVKEVGKEKPEIQ